MPAFNTSPLTLPGLFPPLVQARDGWDHFHDNVEDQTTRTGLVIDANSVSETSFLTLFKTHRSSHYSPGREFWKTIRAKIEYVVENGSADLWQPVYHISTGTDIPRTPDILPSMLINASPKQTGVPGRFTASGAVRFNAADFARRAHVLIGFKISPGSGQIRAATIKMYDSA